ncbi:protein cramped-like [Physella acuta]|uniref:protein cramped-like n=1 Tax=Physella acuta TaxID=109671 RepID=UPI0027DABAA6|nr:protein cramped-like [Physella acuta]
MAPKRRKLSLDEAVGRDSCSKRSTSETLLSVANSHSLEAVLVTDDNAVDKSSFVKTCSEISFDFKTKDDNPKPVRISERLSIKRNRVGDVEEPENVILPLKSQTTPKKPKPAKQGNKKGKKKIRRPCAQWSIRDKKLFFLGLEKYGRNFEAISNKISAAAKVRGFPLKDKTQVRYFYYRIWAKIAKFIHIKDNDVKMKTQELYGLINYGVLKKHVKETDPQFERCLNELIQFGETVYTSRGKRGRGFRSGKIKTPVCTYLKKLNRIEVPEPSENYKMPNQMLLELTPKNSQAWAKVQALSQNPRVRMKVTPNRTLESVFKYLDKKWKPHRVRRKESLKSSEAVNEELVFFLHPHCKLTPVTIIPREQPKIDVTFRSYRENILPTLQKKKRSRNSKESDKIVDDKDKQVEDKPVSESSQDPGPCIKSEQNLISIKDNVEQSCKVSDSPATFASLLSAVATDMSSFVENDPSLVSSTSGPNVPDGVGPTPPGPTPPSVVIDDENAMFPDEPPFSPPSHTSISHTNKPSELRSPPQNVLSPSSLSKRKLTKSSKKLHITDEINAPSDNCEQSASLSDNSLSPSKNECLTSVSVQDLKEESEREVVRLTNLAAEGFTQKSSNNVTLLHLSMMLGRESVIRLEYEWREKNPPKIQLPPLLTQAANQMSNVLRRLCNIATLELTDYSKYPEKGSDQIKNPSKNIPCAHCGRDGPVKSNRSKRQICERRENTKDTGTMTELLKLETSGSQVQGSVSELTTVGGTFIAGPPPGSVQINGPDPIFRVPLLPTYKISREDQLKLEEQQRLQQQAKEIMQQAPSPRRLLKKRMLGPRIRRTPSIIVQRTLLPKSDTEQVVAFIQPSQPLVVKVRPEDFFKNAQPINVISTCQSKEPFKDCGRLENSIQLPTKSIEKNVCPLSPEKIQVEQSQPESVLASFCVTSTSTPSFFNSTSSPKQSSQSITSQGDISMSDFDISLSVVASSNMGPDAGDKFLDMVLQNSEQGFSGLLGTPKKSLGIAENQSEFDSTVLGTPPHSGMSYLHSSANMFPSPIKLDLSDKWIPSESQDVSLSSILGESSSFKTASGQPEKPSTTVSSLSNYAVYFDNGSSDVPEPSIIAFSQPSQAKDISLSSLLGDPSFKKDDSLSSTPVKTGNMFSENLLFGDGSQDSFVKLDVDGTLHGMVNESSLDFVGKFESLAAHISDRHQLEQKTDKSEKLEVIEHVMRVESPTTES